MIPGLEIPAALGYPILIGIVLAIVGYILNRLLKNRPGPPSITEMWARIEVLELKQVASSAREATALKEATDARTETNELKEFIGHWLHRLFDWDLAGRKGRMPLPSDIELARLNIPSPNEGDKP